jgi:hypothetical protein
MINLKGFRRKCSWFNQNTVPAFAWSDWENRGKPVRIPGVSARLERSACRIPLCQHATSQLCVNAYLLLEIRRAIHNYTSVVLV